MDIGRYRARRTRDSAEDSCSDPLATKMPPQVKHQILDSFTLTIIIQTCQNHLMQENRTRDLFLDSIVIAVIIIADQDLFR